ncbi:Transcriptional repressor MprA [Saezia sanguinis]|uniref:Transcriptional repressor MprA n=1 Tax=Saezia sanguinis TaxID=1965230 RepID=A0A433SH29_9BURK|nr:MarR family transcriptional regulator [Saezia sanguinis]RUS68059.1 Transcriptional repressor MprA [Saezia sanguinis]
MDFEKRLQNYLQKYPDAPGDVLLISQLLLRSAQMLEQHINDLLQAQDISLHEYLVLALVSSENGPLRPTELSETLGISRPQITRLLDALEKRGWIIRKHSTVDRRSLFLRLTDKGQERFESAASAVHNAHADSWRNNMKQLPLLLSEFRLLYDTLKYKNG